MSYISSRKIHQMVNINAAEAAAQAAAAEDPDRKLKLAMFMSTLKLIFLKFIVLFYHNYINSSQKEALQFKVLFCFVKDLEDHKVFIKPK
jgi:hypothetical protein